MTLYYNVIGATELRDDPWQGFSITYDGEVPYNPPNWMSMLYDVLLRPTFSDGIPDR
jgi:hypothetical protein